MIDQINSEEEYKAALDKVWELWNSTDPENIRSLSYLLDLIEVYEDIHYSIDPPTLFEAFKFRKDQKWPR